MKSIFKKFQRFGKIPSIEKELLFKGFFLSLTIKILVKFLHFRYYLFLLKTNPRYVSSHGIKETNITLAVKTIKRISKYAPWGCTCLINSITMKCLLNDLGVKSNIIFSVAKINQEAIEAHCYVRIDERSVFYDKKGFNDVYAI